MSFKRLLYSSLRAIGGWWWAILAALVVVIIATFPLSGESGRADKTHEVKEEAGPPKAVSSGVGGPRLAKERSFTYADSAYGKCLQQNGVTKFPPLSKPLVLDTADPVVAKAVGACRSLAPVSPTPTP
ncbi:hypothetical protein [Actinomadura terrae]|uniref:hypothetical protein n=1 Tax=Actinomadura terrae TaxID=604353 RepID=UPI001FA788CE|nr:hypothetical protein [Actinomadura terrae]